MITRLGYPGWWRNGRLWEDSGELPVHLYPFPVTVDGQGPAEPDETFRMICWCPFEGCLGTEDEFGFPVTLFRYPPIVTGVVEGMVHAEDLWRNEYDVLVSRQGGMPGLMC